MPDLNSRACVSWVTVQLLLWRGRPHRNNLSWLTTMTYPVLQRELNVHLDNGRWAVRSIDEQASGILGPVDYGWHRYDEYPDSFTFGEGLLVLENG